MTAILPADLRPLDGHPHASLAVHLWGDLTRIGLPVTLATGNPDCAGAVLAPQETGITVCWRVPGQQAAEKQHRQPFDFGTASPVEADARSDAGHALHAATVLTAGLAGILVSLGYNIVGSCRGPGSEFTVVGLVDDAEVKVGFDGQR